MGDLVVSYFTIITMVRTRGEGDLKNWGMELELELGLVRTTHSAWAEGRFIIYDLVLSSCRCIYGFMAERVGPSGSIHLRRLLCSCCSSWRRAACGRRRRKEREAVENAQYKR